MKLRTNKSCSKVKNRKLEKETLYKHNDVEIEDKVKLKENEETCKGK